MTLKNISHIIKNFSNMEQLATATANLSHRKTYHIAKKATGKSGRWKKLLRFPEII